MMKPLIECLHDEEVGRLLTGEIDAARTSELEQHLANCIDCRQRLEQQVGDDGWWNETESSLRSQHVAASLRDAEDGPAYAASLGETRLRESVLDLLGPTDDPNMLGRIGPYEIIGLLGQGGMGAVFKGFDRSLNRFVAIKMLLPHLAASGAARKRFAREGQAVAAVVDDHVMAIHCVDEWQGVPYLVMTYSRGVSLQKRLSDNGPLEVREILRIGMQAAKGLAAAHAQGIVHRDIKPANIFLDQNVERVQLMDFGLARAVDDASLTRSGTLAGTPQYMSPEQARAETVDHRSDLFSLGSVMYAMCTGHAPFRAESSYSVLRLITDKKPRPILEINPDIPEWLCAIISKLMAKQASDRFDTAKEVAELLEDCLAHVQHPTMKALPKPLAVPGNLFEKAVHSISRTYVKMKSSQLLSGLLVITLLLLVFVVVQSERKSRTMRDLLLREHSQMKNGEQSDDGQGTENAETTQETVPGTVITVNQKQPLSGVWKTKQIITAGQTVPLEKAPTEFVFRRNQMIWKFTGATKAEDLIFDVEVDISKLPQWITLRSKDPKRPQPVLGLFEVVGRRVGDGSDIPLPLAGSPMPDLSELDVNSPYQLRIFTKRDAQGQPSPERPAAIGTGDEPGTDLMILEVKSVSVDEFRTYLIDDYVSNFISQSKESKEKGSPTDDDNKAKIAEVGRKLVDDIEKRFGPCNLIEFDATSNRLLIDHTSDAHQKIEEYLQTQITESSSSEAVNAE